MKAKKIFTDYELAIMKVLWGAGEPLARPKILELMKDSEVNLSSFHFAMNNLIEKGYVRIVGFERCGTAYGRTYAAQVTQEGFVLDMFRETRPDGTAAKGVKDLMIAFVEKEPMDEATISELENMLAERRKSLQMKKEKEKTQGKE